MRAKGNRGGQGVIPSPSPSPCGRGDLNRGWRDLIAEARSWGKARAATTAEWPTPAPARRDPRGGHNCWATPALHKKSLRLIAALKGRPFLSPGQRPICVNLSFRAVSEEAARIGYAEGVGRHSPGLTRQRLPWVTGPADWILPRRGCGFRHDGGRRTRAMSGTDWAQPLRGRREQHDAADPG